MPCYAIIDASKRVHCFAIADVKLLLAYAIEMTELIDMFEMTELIDMFVLCLRFLLCYAIADLKQERADHIIQQICCTILMKNPFFLCEGSLVCVPV